MAYTYAISIMCSWCVCLQVPKKNLTDKEDIKTMRQDVEREIRLLGRINHPHVIKLKESSLAASPYLVLELAPLCLESVLSHTGTFGESLARFYFRQILEGIEACHRAHIFHLDLKPSQILIDHKHALKIADFGFGKSFLRSSSKGAGENVVVEAIDWGDIGGIYICIYIYIVCVVQACYICISLYVYAYCRYTCVHAS